MILIYRKPAYLSRGVRRVLQIMITLGAAVLFSYVIVQTRW